MTATSSDQGAVALTERALLDQLHSRYGATVQGGNRRFVVAEHVPIVPWVMKGGRIADFLAQDCHDTQISRDGRKIRWNAPLPDGYTPDLVSRRFLHGHEVKVSRSDWLTELRDPTKADVWRRYCDRWWLVAARGVAKPDEMPAGWGLIVDGRVVVQAPVLDPDPMPADTRTALLRAVQRTTARHQPPALVAAAAL